MSEWISREELLKDIEAAKEHGGMGSVVAGTLMRYVKRQPSADVKPVRHGRWIEEEMGYEDIAYKCSNCGEQQVIIEGTPKYNGMFFCPCCGAKMDLEETE